MVTGLEGGFFHDRFMIVKNDFFRFEALNRTRPIHRWSDGANLNGLDYRFVEKAFDGHRASPIVRC